MSRKIGILLLLLIICGVAFFVLKREDSSFKSLDTKGMYQRIIEERNFAIQKAVESGDYRCCIDPPCSMCYMEANQWNNNEAGTCACDDLIAQGDEPCPQCKSGLCDTDENGTCEINGS